MKKNRTQQLLIEFVDSIIEQDRCIMDVDAETGNRAAKRYIEAAQELLSGGNVAIESFTSLLVHENLNVRTMAAAFLLKDRTLLAVKTLKPIAKGKGLAALGAQMTLSRYEKGDLEIH